MHKSDVGGVVLNIKSEQHLALEFDRMMQIPDARAIMVQPMLKGTELFVGAKYEEKFGHVVLCGLGGIFVEVLKDVSSGLAPLSYEEAYSMIHSLRAYKIIQGTRGQRESTKINLLKLLSVCPLCYVSLQRSKKWI